MRIDRRAQTSCASGTPSPPSPPTVDVTGRWTGGWTPTQSLGLQARPVEFNAADLNPGAVEGTIEGRVLTFIWTNRNGRARGQFTVDGEKMRGTTQGMALLQWSLAR